jgi:Histidine kinase-like ATPase domain
VESIPYGRGQGNAGCQPGALPSLDPLSAAVVSERVFDSVLAGLPGVRRFVGEAIAAAVVDHQSVMLLATELATNAIIHAQTKFSVRVTTATFAVRVEVTDGATALPIVREPDHDTLSGRGLHIVKALASAWGVEARPGGKCVWFECQDASSWQ